MSRLVAFVVCLLLISIGVLVWWRTPEAPTQAEPVVKKPPVERVRVATWNLLQDDLAQVGTPRGRTRAVARLVEKYQIEVIGAQEASVPQRDRLLSKLQGWKSTDTMNRVIFWDNSLYKLVDSGRFVVAKSVGGQRAAWAMLKSRASKRVFVVFSVHAEPYQKEELQPVDVEQIVAAVKRYARPDGVKVPYFVTGDMNSDYHLQREIIVTGLTEAGMWLSYDHAGRLTGEECATYTDQKAQRCEGDVKHIDHVYVRRGTEITGWRNITDDDATYASDHNPVLIEARFGG